MHSTHPAKPPLQPLAYGNIGLWILQVLLGALFSFAGAMKFVMSVEEMTRDIQLPGWFLHFIGVCEILGGLGLVLPAALGVRPGLTPLAAALLVPIMVGATALSVSTGGLSAGVLPLLLGLACALVAYRRGVAQRRATPTVARP